MNLSVVVITYNEEANIGRTLESVQALVKEGQGEIVVVDSGSTDKTVGIAESYGAKVFVEEWKGYAAQKNSAIDKAAGDWILSLDADEEVDAELQRFLSDFLEHTSGRDVNGVRIPRKNIFTRPMDAAWRLLARCEAAPLPARDGGISGSGGPRDHHGSGRNKSRPAWGAAAPRVSHALRLH